MPASKILVIDDQPINVQLLKRKLERSEAELAKAKKVIEIQGNLSALLEDMLGTESAPGSTER